MTTTRSILRNYVVDRHYYVEGTSGWFVVHCRDKRVAHQFGVREFGRGCTREVRQATESDLIAYKHQKFFDGSGGPLAFEEAPS